MEIVFELLTSDKEEYIIKTPIRQGFCNDVWIKEIRKEDSMAGEIIDVNIYTTLDKLHVIKRNVYY